MKPIRVMIVEDSPTVRASLVRAIRADARLEVVAECESAESALAKLERAAPDVISMDIHLPGICGLEATRRIMERRPTPIVVVSRSVRAQDLESTMEALRAGAVSAMEKPLSRLCAESGNQLRRLCRELAVMSQVKVVRQRFNRPAAYIEPPSSSAIAEAFNDRSPEQAAFIPPSWRCREGPGPAARPRIIGMVASTGGPRALECVLKAVGPEFSLPIVLVQHITASFQKGFVAWLDRVAPQRVVEAAEGEMPTPGCVHVAPASRHLVVRQNRFSLVSSAPVETHRPSGTMLLDSLAASYGARAIGVVLTGMGNDGAAGLLAIRRAGGCTIAEDVSTAVVNGMPEAARALGAVCWSLPLEEIGDAIRSVGSACEEVAR